MEAFLSKYADDNARSYEGGDTTTETAPLPTDPKTILLERKGVNNKKRKRGRPRKDEYNKDDPVKDKEAAIKKRKMIQEREDSLQRAMDKDPPFPTDHSIFSPDPETATTAVILAPSHSGKTTFIVENLNKLTDADLDVYTAILFCTESTCSAPLKHIEERVLKKMNIFDCFLPEYITMLKKTNTKSNNRFRYLVIMDDCLRLRGSVIVDMILTLRNSGVSTVISIQHSKLLTPSQRQSIHDYYLMNLRPEDMLFFLQGFIESHIRDRMNEEGDPQAYDYSPRKLSYAARRRLANYRILHFDQRHDKISIYSQK